MATAAAYRVPHGDFLSWHPHDQDAALAHRQHEAETCSGCGVHPSIVKPDQGGHPNAISPTWTYCRVCDLIGQAQDAGPPVKKDDGSPGNGWHLVLKPTKRHPLNH